jgi:hypothetical protein
MAQQLTVAAPAGAHFEFEEVKTKRGTQSLGDQPILIWDSLDAMVNTYGEEGVLGTCDGTSFRVSFQGIARRMAAAGKSFDEIAQAELQFRPGKRAVGASTPVSRAARAAKKAADVMGDKADKITQLLERVAAGELSEDEIDALLS